MIYLGSDHAGFELKQKIKKYLDKLNLQYHDLGNLVYDQNDDYPDYGYKVAQAVAKNEKSKGILICGSSYGVCIVANKVKGIRAVSINNVTEAKLSREHNDANVLCLAGGQMKDKVKSIGLSAAQAKKIIAVWLKTPVSKVSRHVRRLNKIKKIDK